MIKSLSVRNAPCFPSEGVEIGSFRRDQLLLRIQRNGKTTISRALGKLDLYSGTSIEWEAGRSQPEIKVYNRDYVRNTFGSAQDLPGVFLLGTESKEAREEIEKLIGESGEITKSNQTLSRLRTTRSGKVNDLEKARKKLTDAAWKKRDQIPPALARIFHEGESPGWLAGAFRPL